MPYMRSDLPAHEPLTQTVPVNQAYYTVADNGVVSIALRYHSPSLLGERFDADWQMSLLLSGLPAGSERLYRLGQQSVRIYQLVRGDLRRARSMTGVAVLEAPRNGRLRGRFHVAVRQQQYHFLSGWTPQHYYQAPLLIVVGEFEAVADQDRTSAIVTETEQDAFERQTVPPDAPVSSAETRPADEFGSE